MKDWKKCIVHQTDTILETLRIIDTSALQIGCIVDEAGVLCAIVTDGDVRRALLRGVGLDHPIDEISNHTPVFFRAGDEKSYMLVCMKRRNIGAAPLVDDHRRIIGLVTLSELLANPVRDNIVVLMAGGLGVRLRPLTDKVPKPLLKIGSKPILQTILESFIENGFYRFYFSVNYKAEMIEQYFGDGSRFGVDIKYIHERKRMGTAGALYFLPENLASSVIVMNGDLLTKLNFGEFLDFHEAQQATATMAVREYTYQVPYGVIEYEGEQIKNIVEKPTQSYFIAAGIYALSPEAVAQVKEERYLDMPDLFNQLIDEQKKAVIFPIRDYWMDIGRIDDFRQAESDYGDVFQSDGKRPS